MTAPTVDVTMYWRPGCGFCTALRGGLDRLGVPYEAVNIWEDPEAAEVVRRANHGNELVPTMVIGDTTLSNPRPDVVVTTIVEQDPSWQPAS